MEDMVYGAPAYSVLERDESIRDENGNVLTRITYQQVVLQGEDPAC